MIPQISVVIPTYNRAKLLRKCIKALFNQSINLNLFEIIIVDDGSNDNTSEVLSKLINYRNNSIKIFKQQNNFSGSARNIGIKNASADIILSLDDDILADPNLIEQHLEVHKKYPNLETAVVGKVITSNRGIDIMNPDNRKISSIGITRHGDTLVDVNYFTTTNMSLKREFVVEAGLFTPGLSRMDDMDLAFRLKDKGLKLIYCPEAACIHMRPLDTVEKVVDSGKRYGQTLAEYYRRIPNFQKNIASLGARFNGGWAQLIHHPWNYVKDTGRRWAINQYTIRLILGLASKIPVTNPPSRVLVRLAKEIWAYYFRQEFKMHKG
ncbi:glycosyltransferase family 2 protein [Calditrichota bacterium]